ncbi:MAG: serine/threonine-protein kinase, partial [Planctomycetota bacterium]|nr:serine/threonine-protein kinase [Planctomycetota bacterium]
SAPEPGEEPDPSDPQSAEEGANGSQMLGEYKIIRRLGQGGMAQVFLAEQTSLGRKVALKVMRPERVKDDINKQRFQTEATAAAALSHPNIVAVYTVGEHAGTNFIVQEYVSGGNLRELITKKGPLELLRALQILKQVASALEAAHAAGIVHRDIKPENILLTPKGDVKVADFGLAQLTQEGERLNLTQDGVTMGTPLYMSPEQVSDSKLDARSDIYSLGVTCYHMLAGKPPFGGKTAMAVAMAHVKLKATPLQELRGDIPPDWCNLVQKIVAKMMAKDPAKRYQSATELLRDLKRMAQKSAHEGGDDTDDTEVAPTRIPATPEAPHGSFTVRLARGIWQAPDRSWGGYLLRVFGLAILVAGAAAGTGWLLRTPDPMATEPRRGAVVENLGSADKQYFYAISMGDSIPAWKAVVENFPDKQFYRNYATKQLATLHLARGEFNEAGEYFDQLASLPASEAKFRAFGKAGQAILMTHVKHDYRASQEQISKLVGNFGDFDPWMKDQITDTIQRNRKQLNEELNASLKSILEPRQVEGEP